MSIKSVVETADLGRGLALNIITQKVEANLGFGLTFNGNQIEAASNNSGISNLTASQPGAGNGVLIGSGFVISVTPTINNARAKLPDPATVPGRDYVVRNTSATLTVVLETINASFIQGIATTTTGTITLPNTGVRKTVHVFSNGTQWIWGSIQ